ncbi:MAG: PD-(D/E)XK nuclease family protein [Clostridia bacterium]|nr:PD-(D/E)XK nuclease family protein [Clostridia bacterium]
MSGTVTFIEGRAGSRKSTLLMERASELAKAQERVIVLVPEQFTFAAERTLVDLLGHGLLDPAVFSFTSLADYVLEAAGDRKQYLSAQGKRMVIRKVIEERSGMLETFRAVAHTNGFARKCGELFSRFKRFLITPEMLDAAAKDDAAPPVLGRKLRDISLLYRGVEDYLQDRYMDGEDMINALIDKLPDSFARGAHVFVDGFEFLTEQKFRVVRGLMEVAAGTTIAACIDTNCRDAELFELQTRGARRLADAAYELGLPVRRVKCARNGSEGFAQDLSHMERELFAFPFEPYDGDTGITVFTASSKRGECDALCNAIVGAANAGLRYRDMAVLVCDPAAYRTALTKSLRRYGIPYFMDATRPLGEHPVAELMVASLRCCINGYAREDVLRLLRSGFVTGDRDSVELFENHALKYDISGLRFLSDFTQEDTPTGVNELRRELIEPLTEFRAALSGERTVSGKVIALYNYMEARHAGEKADALADELRSGDKLQLSEETSQAWSTSMELLGQLHAIMHDVRTSNERFCEILEEGLSSYSIGVIPTTVDQLLVGDVERTCAEHMQKLFVLGASEGSFPSRPADDDIIDDRELAFLQGLGMSVWDNSRQRGSANAFSVYSALCRAKRSVYLSYTHGLSDLPQSSIIDRLREVFPKLREETDLTPELTAHHVEMGRSMLNRSLRMYVDNGALPKGADALAAWFLQNELTRDDVARMSRLLFYGPVARPFGAELAKRLYGDDMSGSASRLERFNLCPFMHFMQYGLRARERDTLRERPVDEGSFYHDVMDKLFARIAELKLDYTQITRAQLMELLEPILTQVAEAHNNGIFDSSAVMRAAREDMCDASREAAWAAVQQVAAGKFRPIESEIRFGDGMEYPAYELTAGDGSVFKISGAIDRLDAYRHGDKVYIRVIDYKTRGKSFSYDELFSGIRIQLPLYALAMLAADSSMRAAGIYYMPIRQALAPDSGTELTEDELLRQFAFSGVTLDEAAVLSATDLQGTEVSAVTGVGGKRASERLIDASGMSQLLGYAERKATRTLQLIMQGHAEASPAASGGGKESTPCRYCSYNSICMYDEAFAGCSPRRLARMSQQEFLESAGAEPADSDM